MPASEVDPGWALYRNGVDSLVGAGCEELDYPKDEDEYGALGNSGSCAS